MRLVVALALSSAWMGCAAAPRLGSPAAPAAYASRSAGAKDAPELGFAEPATLRPAAPSRAASAARLPSAEVPDRDPAARGQLAVDMSAADLPDDRDGDGVDQLRLCPELLPDRVDGCPRAR